MKTYRKSLVLTLFVVVMLILSGIAAGCDNSHKNNQPDKSKSGDTITVIDCIGRKVSLPAYPQRIACLCPESGHALAMFGKGDKIVAAVDGMQRDLLLLEMYPHIKDLPLPKSSGVINIEELAKCKPDVVLVKGDTANNQAEVAKLNKVGIPFLVVQSNNMQEQQQCMAMIGEMVGASDQARQYINYYQKCLQRVADKVGDIPEKERVRVYHSLNEATRTSTRGSLPADWIQAAGAINVALDRELKLYEGKYYASLEQILLWNPDVILVNDSNVVGYIMENEQWRPIKAVREERVLALPNGISRWGHFSSLETPLAVMWTAKTLYPDKFLDIDMVAETKYFYREFFRMDLSDETVHMVLSGQGMRAPKG